MRSAPNTAALRALVARVTPDLTDAFEFVPAEGAAEGCFEIEPSPPATVLIRSGHTRDMAAGYGWYLKHVLQLHLSRSGDRLQWNGPPRLPSAMISQSSPWKYRYAYNYCALCYTLAFEGWASWEREIDLLALNGFTHALVTAGLERVWQQTLSEMAYPADRIGAFIANPAYAAWWHMGNLEGTGGPLSPGLIEREAELGARIVSRMRELGITPVLQGFMGLVPHDTAAFLPHTRVFAQGKWLDEFQRPALLDPESAAFGRWASAWYRNLHELYGGATSAYAGDLFHEGGECGGLDLPGIAVCIQQAMQQASPASRWLLQSWRENPLPSLLKGLDRKHCLVLELWKDLSETQMRHDALRTYGGRPWVWCEVTNFGGNHNLYGGLSFLSELPSWLLQHPGRDDVCGLGLLSEGLDTNPIGYDLFMDLFFTRKNIDLQQWLDQYVVRRYGSHDAQARKALDLLASSVYDVQDRQEGSTESILCASPSLRATRASNWASGRVYYHPCQVIEAAGHLLKAGPEVLATATGRYDLVDVVRQVLADMARPLLAEIRHCFSRRDRAAFRENTALFLELFDDTERLLATDVHWLLGSWLKKAKGKGRTPKEKALMERAARRMVTSWSGGVDLLNEYSNRQWAGLMKDYYKPRWQMFFDYCIRQMDDKGAGVSFEPCAAELAHRETDFETRSDVYPAEGQGDTIAVAAELFARRAPQARVLWDRHPELVAIR